jgi:hypothetical protein
MHSLLAPGLFLCQADLSRAIMVNRGFPLSLLNRLVRAGLATSHVEREEPRPQGDRDRG